ncbi:MAG: outer membrane beta-barrel protein [Myxococcales bacterium]|nr:outer membrane beta-barrel protein [Myxococcales bacterium]
MAHAQTCPPGSILCANLQFGAGVSVNTVPPPPPPMPAAPVVIVQAPPPPPVYYAPPPPPPTRMVVVTQPEVAYTTTTYQTYGFAGRQQLGFGVFGAGLALGERESSRGAGMGGVGANMRFRYSPHFATELAIAAVAGRDYNGDDRAEVPLTVSQLFYFNPQNRLQLYALVGLGGSFAGVTYTDASARERGRDNAAYGYFGAQAGLGLEWQLSRNFSLFGDFRGFIRTRVDNEVEINPEFRRAQGGRVETTNTSAGVMGTFGGMFYF